MDADWTTGAEIAAAFEQANGEAVAFVLGPARAHWDAITADEGWPVGVAARHIALGHDLIAGWLEALRDRVPITGGFDIHERNAEIAAQGVVANPDAVAAHLEDRGRGVAAVLRELTADHLKGDIDFAGRVIPRQMLAGVSVRHVQAHLASIRAAVDEV